MSKKKDKLYMAFIQDDEGDVTRGPAEPYKDAVKRMADAASSSDWVVKTWTEEVK